MASITEQYVQKKPKMTSIKALKSEFNRLDKDIENDIEMGMKMVDYLKYPENPPIPAHLPTLRMVMDHVKGSVFEQLDIMKELERRGKAHSQPYLGKKNVTNVMDWLEHYADNGVPMEESEEEGEVD